MASIMRMRLLPSVLALSAAGAIGMAVHEGYRSNAYDDGAGVQTIGFGTTAGVRPGDRIDPVRALVRLGQDADRMQREMRACIGPVPLYQHEWDAYVSLTYNIGSGAFCRSTLVRYLRATPPNYAAACNQILRWNQAAGRVWPGLTTRRQDEHRLCTQGRP